MPALKPTDYSAEIVWLGRVEDREEGLASLPQEQLNLTWGGPQGESHGGEIRPSCSRVLSQYERGTPIRNTRQLSILSQEELDMIAADMGIKTLDPSWVGASVVIQGIPDFSHIPPSSRLQNQAGVCVTIDMQNRPCHLPVKVIEAVEPEAAKRFKTAAQGRRGVTGWVEREGIWRIGDTLRLHVPDQRGWTPGFI